MADDDTSVQNGRLRQKVPPIKVWVTNAEKAEIADRAAQACSPLPSSFMASKGLKSHPRF